MAKLSDLPNIISKALSEKVILEAGAKIIKPTIQKRTRLGKGVKENLGPNHPLPKLTKTTVSIRKKLAKSGGLTGPGATPAKSGLNRTGDLLDSIEVEVNSGEIKVGLPAKEERKFNEVLDINDRYQFMRLSRAEFKQVLERIQSKLNTILARINITDL